MTETAAAEARERPPYQILALIAVAAGVFATLHASAGHLIMPRFVPLSSDVFSTPVHWGAWIAVAPLVGWVIDKYPLEAGRFRRGIAANITLVLVLAPILGLLVSYTRFELMLWHVGAARADRFRWNPPVAIAAATIEMIGDYVVLVGLCYAFTFYRRARARELHASELQRLLTGARLHALQAQLQPHFLFNALNSTAMLALTNAQAARDMLVRISDLLRRSLGASEQLEVPLSEEIDFLDRYLAIERVRFGERLHVAFEVDDAALPALVPSLILQPIVENAVRHGVSKRRGPGIVTVRARRIDDAVILEVEDDGPGPPVGWDAEAAHGVGIANVRQRLLQTYGAKHELRFIVGVHGGLLVRIRCPLRLPLNAVTESDHA
jgi:signal transduction histidine kinase